MLITKQRFIAINKYALIAAIIVYLAGVFTSIKPLQPGIIFTFAAGFFLVLHQPYFLSRVDRLLCCGRRLVVIEHASPDAMVVPALRLT